MTRGRSPPLGTEPKTSRLIGIPSLALTVRSSLRSRREQHEVRHDGESDRVVLLINFWHPDLPPDQRRITLDTMGYDPI